MSSEKTRAYLRKKGFGSRIIEFDNPDVTVQSTATALDVEPDRICKGLAFKAKGGGGTVVLTSGNVHVDNHKFKDVMGYRPSMISAETVEEITGYMAGTINPFCLNDGVRLYLDLSIRKHLGETVFPGIGDTDSVVELTIDELEKLTDFECWIDVCR